MGSDAFEEPWNARSFAYAFLGNTMMAPMKRSTAQGLDPGFWDAFPIKNLGARADSALVSLAARAESSIGRREELIRAIAVDYTKLFVGPGIPLAPPWETVRKSGGNVLYGTSTVEVRAFLREQGVSLSREAHQLEDHIGVEFLALSAQGSSWADREPSPTQLESALGFPSSHLREWVSPLCATVRQHEKTGYYGDILEVAEGILAWDARLLGEALSTQASPFREDVQ